ncbi:SLC13 family permease [Acidaminobacter sp.]|uniref:SLC13 family permease n=1 Tax=Acidaminobacter sp. TaxID=1872102 RepID=UPI00256CF85B|nr:SLC13 family permease [Acidaminobacter sp.]MDK9711500.1 SLC13 family permease [Acidaminobacter sp.]
MAQPPKANEPVPAKGTGTKYKDLLHLKTKTFLICLAIASGLTVINPLGLDLKQQIVFGSLLLTVLSWAFQAISQSVAAVFLLAMFSTFGMTPLQQVFKFPLSDNFITIAMSFLMSQAIVNSGIAARLADTLLARFVRKPMDLIWVGIAANFLLMFLIPQPFSRTILLAAIFVEYIKRHKLPSATSEIIMLNLFVTAVTTLMMFLTADVILNNFAVEMSGTDISWFEWAKWMAVPSFVTTLIMSWLLIVMNRKVFEVALGRPSANAGEQDPEHIVSHSPLSKSEKIVLALVLATVGLWMTESLHGISSAWVAVACVAGLAVFTGTLKFQDLKSLNFPLMLFLTAAFSIGSVMQSSGISAAMFSVFRMDALVGTAWFVPAIIGLNAVIHQLVGSTVTSLSITVPGLRAIAGEAMNPIAIMFMSYVTVNLHFFLPFQQIVLLIGIEHYSPRHILKIGVVMTVLTPVIVLLLYMPWFSLVQ